MQYYLVITPFFPTNESFRGPYVYDQVKAIERTGRYKVVVFKSTSKNNLLKKYTYQGIQVYLFPRLRIPGGLVTNILDNKNDHLFIKCFKETGIDIHQIAFVHCHCSNNARYGLAVRKLNPTIKVLLQHHDLDPLGVHLERFKFLKWNIWFKVWCKSKVFNEVDLHICISQWVKEYLECFPNIRKGEIYKPFIYYMQKVKGMKSLQIKNSYILYNGVDTNLFYKKEGGKDKEKFRIGCIANFQDLKQHITLLQALDILINKDAYQDIQLSLIGSGETITKCKEFISEHNLNKYVVFQSEVDHTELPAYYNSLDLFVLPSVFEGFGCVYTEAYACGVPFIGVQNQGAAEIIMPTESNRWLIPPYDYKQLAVLIKDYYTYRYEQKLCKEYDINKLISDFLKYIENLKSK